MENIILTSLGTDELIRIISESIKKEIESASLFRQGELPTEYITRKETAHILGISLPTLNDWSKRGIIPSFRIGTRIRYRMEDVRMSLNKVVTIK